MRRIDPKDVALRPFAALDDEWAILVGGKTRPNPMTVSWGGLGTLWSRPVVTVYVRPTRFTWALLTEHPELTLSFLPEALRPALEVCGTTSGRDTDKWAASGLVPVPSQTVEVPRVQGASLSLECRILASFDLDPSRFLDPTVLGEYPQRDFHRAFIGQVLAAFAA